MLAVSFGGLGISRYGLLLVRVRLSGEAMQLGQALRVTHSTGMGEWFIFLFLWVPGS